MSVITRIALYAALVIVNTQSAFAADSYSIDKSHTRILFFVNHLGFSDTIGDFTEYYGSFTFDEKKPETSTIDFTLKPESIKTSSSKLDSHIQGKKFFNTEQYPDIHFVSRSITVTGKNTGNVTGDLTMLGVTKPVTLKVTFNKGDYHPITNMYVAGFSATASIKRSEFGMTHLVPMVSDEVKLTVELEGVNETRKKAESIRK